MTIRRATASDAAVLSRIHAKSWKSAYAGIVPQKYLDELKEDFWVSYFENGVGNGAVSAFIVYDNAIPVGCAAYGKSREEKFPEWGEIISIYVLPEYYRKGCGKKILSASLSALKLAGFNDVYLWVLEENLRAIRFYERNGFYPANDKYHTEVMGKPLLHTCYILNQ